MSLSLKIFLTFFISVAALLFTTLYLIGTQSEQHEIERIVDDLNKTQNKFQYDLEAQQQHIQSLGHIITTDQKFRSFLSQIKDNFYPFTAEIGKGTHADFVYMLDDEPAIRATYTKNELLQSPLNNNLSIFEIEHHLDSGLEDSKMISTSGGLYSTHFIPLKESLIDDYAVGLIIVSNKVNDTWVAKLLNNSSGFQTVFFTSSQIVAKNTSLDLAQSIYENRQVIKNQGMFYFDHQRYIGKLILFDPENQQSGYILSSNLDSALAKFEQLQLQILMIGSGILFIGALLFLWISRHITHPLRLITKGTLAIERGNYQHRINYQSKDEIGKLSRSFNIMADGLQEKERIHKTFNSYVDPAIVSELLSQPDNLKLGGERKEQSILFSDIADFTKFSEKLPAETLVKILNEYLTAMTHEISQQKGILDKFIGDAIMAFWSPQVCKNDHAQLACESALNMQEILTNLRPAWKKNEGIDIHIRIGIATGEMIVGSIGSETARSYTCIGDKVNYSSRLEGLNKHYGTQIIIDKKTADTISGFVIRELDTVIVKGREQGENIYELVGRQSDTSELMFKILDTYQKGLNLYRAGDFSLALENLATIHHDNPSHLLINRCKLLLQKPPKHWNGIHSMVDK